MNIAAGEHHQWRYWLIDDVYRALSQPLTAKDVQPNVQYDELI